MPLTTTDDILQYLLSIFTFDSQHPLLFTQVQFWIFFAVVLFVLALIGHNKIAMRNAFLFFASIFFYYKTSGDFTVLLIVTTALSYVVGRQVGRCQREAYRRAWLAVGISLNLIVLAYFKYAYLISDMLADLFGIQIVVRDYLAEVGNTLLGSQRFSTDYIFLPVGISFYTFQCISYQMDIYRRRIRPLADVFDYGFYVSFFPQLVAGPIVRANEFVGQLSRPYSLSRRWFGVAIFWILNGLAKKIILSDYLAVNFIDRIFANPTMYGGFENLCALFVYSLQIYADFSGYTDIAIGVALIMGFYLPTNFRSPYKAVNCGEFWKRWHISLSKWLQDYLYISLGGNRRAGFGTYAVILTIALVGTVLSGSVWVAVGVMIAVASCAIAIILHPEKKKGITSNINRMNTMLLGGLWHGASWNFMIWGGLNGLGMLIWRTWHPIGVHARAIIATSVAVVVAFCAYLYNAPLLNIAAVWLSGIAVVSIVRSLYNLSGAQAQMRWAARAWAITQTFVYITFTRLFFRAGSNLNPAEANQVAIETAKQMVGQIGGTWNATQIPAILSEYRNIFILFVLGMIIHWIPEDVKRRYRICFASLPHWLMIICIVVIVVIIYQFITADLQKFVYFQF